MPLPDYQALRYDAIHTHEPQWNAAATVLAANIHDRKVGVAMLYIKKCEAPDLSDLGDHLLSQFVAKFFLDVLSLPKSASASRLLTEYLMVTDKAVREYIAGRNTLIAYSSGGGNVGLIAEGLGRFETCINSMMRAFRLLDKMFDHKENPAFDKARRQLIGNCKLSVAPVRDIVRHIAKDIVARNVAETDTAYLLAINQDGNQLDIGDHNLALVEIADALRNLHNTGCELIDGPWNIEA